MSFFKSLFKKKESFALYQGPSALLNSFSDQIANIFSFAAPQKPFKATSEDDVWKEAYKDIDDAVKNIHFESKR